MNLDTLLESSFEDYMKGCWQHAYNQALKNSAAYVVYQYMCESPMTTEAIWARRYYFNKLGHYDK